jgi:prepilin-type N-terminal cleavage/methylation domain-containing protein
MHVLGNDTSRRFLGHNNMSVIAAKKSQHAFSMLELLAVLAIMAVLVGLLMPALANARGKARRGTCNGHMKNVGLAVRIFATDHDNLYPWESDRATGTNRTGFPDLNGLAPENQVLRVFLSLSNELSTPKIVACPADTRKAIKIDQYPENWRAVTTDNISYFLAFTAREKHLQSFMSGDRNMVADGQVLSGRSQLTETTKVAWDEKTIHRGHGEICLADGSVDDFTTTQLQEALRNTKLETNILVFP